jgi:PAS domain-containing protein
MHQASSTPTPPTESPQPDVLGRLTDLSRELAGAYQPATVIARLAEAITELLAPSRLTILLLDPATNRLHLAYHRGGDAPHVDAPLLQLPLRRGPMVFSHHVLEEAARHGVAVTEPVAAWMGAPLVAAGRTIGVAAVASNRVEAYGPAESTLLTAMLAQAAIALENARLLELLSSGKRQWELTVDVIHQAICIVDAQGIVRRANRVFADLVRTPVTALPGTPWMSPARLGGRRVAGAGRAGSARDPQRGSGLHRQRGAHGRRRRRSRGAVLRGAYREASPPGPVDTV